MQSLLTAVTASILPGGFMLELLYVDMFLVIIRIQWIKISQVITISIS